MDSSSWSQAYGSVLVCTLTREIVTTAWCVSYKNLQIPSGQACFMSGMPFNMARNMACQKLLELGWEYLFFLDDDTIVPPDTIPRLMSHNKDIVSGLYYRRNEPLVPCMLLESDDGTKKTWIQQYKIPDLLSVDYVGSGCLMIHRKVLESLPALSPGDHWFEWRVTRLDLPEHERLSEDFTFCKHARNHGYKIYVDTSIQCQHCGHSKCVQPGKLEVLTI